MSSRLEPFKPLPAEAAPAARRKTIWMYAAGPKIQPKTVKGWFNHWRWVMVWFTQLLFYGLPWLPWNGRPALLFDLEARRFYIFDLLLYPQDFIYLTGLLILCAYGLFLFTAVAGRQWCGYTCPQTVYTEIFLWVEHRIEGDRSARLRLDAGGMTAEKLLRRGGKHLVWLAIGLWTGFSFVGYFTPIRELGQGVLHLQLGSWENFWVLFYGFSTYGNAGFMREQVCKYMCPYARFQSAMFDKDTLIVGYDARRGEPRTLGVKGPALDGSASKGACIDCGLCVQVCPTGIDIRQGLQYECISCAACIDACDGVMDKLGRPKGLIRYATQRGLEAGERAALTLKSIFRPRVLVYSLVMVLISAAFVGSLALRPPVRMDVVRDRGVMAREVEDGIVENVYRLQLMNLTEQPQRLRIEVQGLPGLQAELRGSAELGPAETHLVPLALRLAPEAAAGLERGATLPVTLTLVREAGPSGPEHRLDEATTFYLPR
ncbi:cytochrome c oxidase accessory protein CcoG [Piscinibacter sp. Jin2]|uniref:Cytochrome c oxidase accessory protein CcoG n=1 Tax=Aquariibacter lacus TaxID=2801332 RepID=A0A9X1BNN8_9BURK|nr:cytochrome c oxidase accessory protein CcoG [Piscinibacter lacus]MBL0720285.1 cytochrome c oxidase accessory protein CcoG [Piscinibacter lacus]